MVAAAEVRRAVTDDGDSQSTNGHGTASVTDNGTTCGGVWGAPAPVSDGNVNDGRGCEDAPVGTARYMRMAETEAKNTHEHFSLINDLAEHV